MKMLPDGSLQAETDDEVQLLLRVAQTRVQFPVTPSPKVTPLAPPSSAYVGETHNGTVAVLTDVVTVLEEEEPHPLEAEPVIVPTVKRHVTPGDVATREKAGEVAYVTQAEKLAIGYLKSRYPDAVKTKQAATMLRWSREKATRIITGMERRPAGLPKLVEKIPGTYRYKLTPFGKRAQLVVVTQPARFRGDEQ